MPRTPDEIEGELSLPEDVVNAAVEKTASQDENRGDWPSPRECEMPNPPWPDRNDPMLRFLLAKAVASLEAGMETRDALIQLATHCWFEGGIENYDRGQRDARRPRPVS